MAYRGGRRLIGHSLGVRKSYPGRARLLALLRVCRNRSRGTLAWESWTRALWIILGFLVSSIQWHANFLYMYLLRSRHGRSRRFGGWLDMHIFDLIAIVPIWPGSHCCQEIWLVPAIFTNISSLNYLVIDDVELWYWFSHDRL
jgi:hypothetical protein